MNPSIGDVSYDLYEDIYRCPYWKTPPVKNRQNGEVLNIELIEMFENYADWLIEVWDFLENGEYSCV